MAKVSKSLGRAIEWVLSASVVPLILLSAALDLYLIYYALTNYGFFGMMGMLFFGVPIVTLVTYGVAMLAYVILSGVAAGLIGSKETSEQ